MEKLKVIQYGPAFKFEYVLLVPVKGKNMKITFDDWIFMQDEKVAINRATTDEVWYLKLLNLTVMFVKKISNLFFSYLFQLILKYNTS